MATKTATWTAGTPPTGKAITGYKVYSSVDGEVVSVGVVLTTPITLTDGNNHNVTCKAQYDDASEGLVSNVEVVDLTSNTLFVDDFTGTVIDTGKWTTTNPNSSGISFVQNGDLKIQSLAGGVLDSTDYLKSITTFEIGNNNGIKVFSFDIKLEVPASTTPITKIGIGRGTVGDSSTSFYFGRQSGTQVNLSGNLTTLGITLADAAVSNSFKMVFDSDGESMELFKWEPGDSVWTSVGTRTPPVAGAWDDATYDIWLTQASYSTGTRDCFVDNIYVSDANYSTQYPT